MERRLPARRNLCKHSSVQRVNFLSPQHLSVVHRQRQMNIHEEYSKSKEMLKQPQVDGANFPRDVERVWGGWGWWWFLKSSLNEAHQLASQAVARQLS